MEDKLKKALKKTIDSLDDIDDVFEDFFESLPDRAEEAHKSSRAALRKVKQRLDASLKDADVIVDETQLQAHLGLMEARDRLEASRPVMDDLMQQARDRGHQIMDEAQLKGHLAAMEAEDYWDRDGRDLAKKFADSSDDMLKTATDTIDEMQTRLSAWVASMRENKSS